MNIDKVEVEIETPDTWLKFFEAVFKRQDELRKRYDGIEAKNGVIIPKEPWHIDDRFVQFRIKDMFWRFTEEIMEAFENIDSVAISPLKCIHHWLHKWEEDPNIRHFFEELADALHFITEASLLANLEPKDIIKMTIPNTARVGITTNNKDALSIAAFNSIYMLGLAANCLKQKPWKQTHMPTDQAKFNSYLVKAWVEFFRLFGMLGCDIGFIFQVYFKKSIVNTWRQNTKY